MVLTETLITTQSTHGLHYFVKAGGAVRPVMDAIRQEQSCAAAFHLRDLNRHSIFREKKQSFALPNRFYLHILLLIVKRGTCQIKCQT